MSALRALSYDIEGEVQSQNRMLEEMVRRLRPRGASPAGRSVVRVGFGVSARVDDAAFAP